MTSLTDIIIDKIRTEGPISFHDFMELSLYYPGLGYYTSTGEKFGTGGDYYTSCTLTPFFGAMIARQIEEMWSRVGEEEFTIVEYGAGMGFLCRDILNALKANSRMYSKLRYCIIEKSSAMQAQEKQFLTEKVSWHDSIESVGKVNGCVLSNEVADNFAVHQVVMADELMEVFVDYKDGFTEVLLPASGELKDYFSALHVQLPKGYRTEINLEAIDWMKNIATSLNKGYVITIDYGYPAYELYSEYRSQGTIVCFNKHRTNTHPYQYIGMQDITAHVNFSALHHWGAQHGLEGTGFTDQAHFLLSLGIDEYLNGYCSRKPNDALTYKHVLALRHTLLADMGSKFKVLIQQKGLPMRPLQGLSKSPYLTMAAA